MSSLWPIYYRIYEKFILNDVIFYQIFKDHGLLGRRIFTALNRKWRRKIGDPISQRIRNQVGLYRFIRIREPDI